MREALLVARREYLAYIGAWGFWVSLLTTPILLVLVVLGPLALRQAEPERKIAIIAERAGDAAAVEKAFAPKQGAERLARATYRVVPAPAKDLEALKPFLTGARGSEQSLFAVVVVRRTKEGAAIDYWSANLTDREAGIRARRAMADVIRAETLTEMGIDAKLADEVIATTPDLKEFDPRAAASAGAVKFADRAPFLAAFALGFVLWVAIVSIANMLLSSVIEEKSNKILDSLMTAASPLSILTGKLIGVAAVSATLFGVWGAVSLVGAQVLGQTNAEAARILAQAVKPELLAIFAGCFICGYLLYGALFLALGSMCETVQEAQTLVGPVIMFMAVPILMFGPAFENPNSALVATANWIPPFAPFLTMLRAPAGLSAAELTGLFGLMIVSVVLILWFSARLFHAGVSGQASVAALRAKFSRKPKAG
jgi:ABC-2 type transport system permease protein